MRWLVRDAQPNDSLFFHCTRQCFHIPHALSYLFSTDSGHGGQTKDTDGDEGDGFDEGLSFMHCALYILNIL